MTKTRVGICTGGGDAPGLNAVIRGFVRHAVKHFDLEVVGIEDSFNGLVETPRRLRTLDLAAVRGLVHLGGTMLGTTNRGDPFAFPVKGGPKQDFSQRLVRAVAEEGLAGIVVAGGDGTQAIGLRLMRECGIRVIGVPKTIDNDLAATDTTFGFMSAVEVATEALDRLHTTAEAHDRVMILEVMGRDAGHIALHAGIAGGADVILLPEIPYDAGRVAAEIARRQSIGRNFSIVVVAEGALPAECAGLSHAERKARLTRGGGAAAIAMSQLEGRIDAEMRATVLGHLQRGGSPVALDRILGTRFGVAAAELVAKGQWGYLVALRGDRMVPVLLEEACARQRLVDPADALIATGRAVGVEFGAP